MKTPSSPTLEEAYIHACQTRWNTKRDGGASLKSQAKLAIATIQDMAIERGRIVTLTVDTASLYVLPATAAWYKLGLSPATINKRLNCLSVMGINVQGMRQPKSRDLKWYLSEEEAAKAVAYLLSPHSTHTMKQLGRLIAWTTKTGLRIEETLRLTRADFSADFSEVSVPGFKTAASQARLPLSAAAQAVPCAVPWNEQGQPFILATYDQLEAAWNALRTLMGWTGNGVTMKALRRSAARHLHADCGMPLDMVRQYLRHESINTTMEYLRLTGGYGTEEMRRYLK
jgi:integrase